MKKEDKSLADYLLESVDEEIIDAICKIGTIQAYSAEEIAKGIKIWEEQNGINRSDTR